jgi:predicted enzyme related to lactoylglutathione lyase
MSMSGRIAQIALPVRDLARATAFYRDVVGLPLLFEVPNLAFFDCAGTRLMLGAAEEERHNGASVIYYAADDVRTEHERLASLGVTVERAPHVIARLGTKEVWMAFFTDSEGNTFAAMSEHEA